jgi:hypothetical protein
MTAELIEKRIAPILIGTARAWAEKATLRSTVDPISSSSSPAENAAFNAALRAIEMKATKMEADLNSAFVTAGSGAEPATTGQQLQSTPVGTKDHPVLVPDGASDSSTMLAATQPMGPPLPVAQGQPVNARMQAELDRQRQVEYDRETALLQQVRAGIARDAARQREQQDAARRREELEAARQRDLGAYDYWHPHWNEMHTHTREEHDAGIREAARQREHQRAYDHWKLMHTRARDEHVHNSTVAAAPRQIPRAHNPYPTAATQPPGVSLAPPLNDVGHDPGLYRPQRPTPYDRPHYGAPGQGPTCSGRDYGPNHTLPRGSASLRTPDHRPQPLFYAMMLNRLAPSGGASAEQRGRPGENKHDTILRLARAYTWSYLYFLRIRSSTRAHSILLSPTSSRATVCTKASTLGMNS